MIVSLTRARDEAVLTALRGLWLPEHGVGACPEMTSASSTSGTAPDGLVRLRAAGFHVTYPTMTTATRSIAAMDAPTAMPAMVCEPNEPPPPWELGWHACPNTSGVCQAHHQQ